MRSPPRAWSFVWLLAATAAPSCGRIGFDPAADDAGPEDASARQDKARDASVVSMRDASAVLDAPAPADAPAADAPTADVPGTVDSGVDADASCPVSPTVDYCSLLPPLPAPPTIDGVLDCGPALVPAPPVDWIGPSPLPAFPGGNAVQVAVAWRPDGLYVFMVVTTPAAFPAELSDPVFYGAGVELFVDDDAIYANPPTFDNPGTIQLVVAAPPDSMTPGRRAEGFRNAADEGAWASSQYATYPTATGFVFEGFVVAADLGLTTWALAPGDAVGLDLAVDVSYPTAAMTGPQGHRVGQYFFHVTTAPGDAAAFGMPYGDPRSFCAPTLAPM